MYIQFTPCVQRVTDFDITCPNMTTNSLSADPTKWSNTLKQFVGNLPTNWLSMFDRFVILALKGLRLTNYYDQSHVFRDRRQVWLAMLSQFKLINYLLFPLKSSQNHTFCDDFRGIVVNQFSQIRCLEVKFGDFNLIQLSVYFNL